MTLKKIQLDRSQGFTLIELLVTVAVIIVLLVLGVPEYQRLTEGNRHVAALNSMVGDLNLARTEAVKQGRTVTVCIRDTAGTTCDSGKTAWEAGWIAFIDKDADQTVDNDDVLLSRRGALPEGLTLRSVEFSQDDLIQYAPNGAMLSTNGTFVLCDSSGDQTRARAINVSNLGRVSLAKDTDNDGILEDVEDSDISCP